MPPVDPRPDEVDVLVCPRHPERAAAAACIECGRLVCPECRKVGDDGLTVCLDCLADHPVDDDTGAPTSFEGPRRVYVPPAAEPKPTPPPQAAEPSTEIPAPAEPELGAAELSGRPPVGPLAPPGAPGAIVAWEGPVANDLRAWARTAMDALSSPVRFPLSVPWVRGDLLSPLIYALLCVSVGMLAGTLTGSLGGAHVPPALQQLMGGQSDLPPLAWHLMMLPVVPLSTVIGLGIMSGASHLLLRVFNATRLPFEATFRAYCYAQTGKLLLALPAIGAFAGSIYEVFLLLGGLRLAHRTGFATGLLAMLPLLLFSRLGG